MGACASRFEVLKDGANPPPPPMAPPVVDDYRLSFDHLLEKNEGERVSSEREGKASPLVQTQDLGKENCQENGSLKSLQPVHDPASKTVERLMCKTPEEIKTDDAINEESEAIPRNVEQEKVEITGKDLKPV